MPALKRSLSFLAIVLAMCQASARADLLLVNSPGSQVSSTAFQGGTFTVSGTFIGSAGTGNIDPFVRIQANGNEAGYNTDFATPSGPLDDKAGTWTHSLQLSAVPIVTIGGIAYREFLLDANQAAGNTNIPLNQVQLFQSSADVGLTGAFTDATASTNASISFPSATLVFQMSAPSTSAADSHTVLVSSGNGSGTLDMALYVRSDLFSNTPNSFVTLFSQLGTPPGSPDSSDGFEEWKVRETSGITEVVPEPSTMALAALGAMGFLGYGLRRRLGK